MSPILEERGGEEDVAMLDVARGGEEEHPAEAVIPNILDIPAEAEVGAEEAGREEGGAEEAVGEEAKVDALGLLGAYQEDDDEDDDHEREI